MKRRLLAAAVLLAATVPAGAHHIMGIPHYAYDEQYPQTPVLTYRLEAGPYDVKMTNYPGRPEPGERCTLHIYIHRAEDNALYEGTVTAQVMRDGFLGEAAVVYGPVTAEMEERVFKFYPEFEEEANYTVRVTFDVEGTPWMVDLPMVAGEPGSPWAVVGGCAAGLAGFLIVVRAVRIKRRRAAARRHRARGPAIGERAAATP